MVQSHWLYGLDKGCKKPFKTVKNIGGIACMFIKAHPCGFVVWHFFKSIKNKLVLLALYSPLVIVQKRTLSTLLLRKPFAWTWKLIFISKLYAKLTRLMIDGSCFPFVIFLSCFNFYSDFVSPILNRIIFWRRLQAPVAVHHVTASNLKSHLKAFCFKSFFN